MYKFARARSRYDNNGRARVSPGGGEAASCSFRIETGAGCARWINAIPVIRHGILWWLSSDEMWLLDRVSTRRRMAGWYTCQWPAWLDQHTRNNAYTGRWTPSTETILSLPFSPSHSLIRAQCSTAFYCICTGTRIHATLRACDWRSLKSAARLPTIT